MADSTPTTRKGVKTITLTLGSTSATLLSATVYTGATADKDEIGAFGDYSFTTVPRPVRHAGEFKFTLLDEGASSALRDLVGTVVSVTLSGTWWDGKTTDTAVGTLGGDMAITGVEAGGEVALNGEREATITVTAVPQVLAAVGS